VPSFAVDDGFAYDVPDSLPDLAVGDIVRVPLGGRRVRGYVTTIREEEPDRPLRAVAARSGRQGVFDSVMLESLRWVASHYVAPLSTVLARCAPPNLPRKHPRRHAPFEAANGGPLAAWGERQMVSGRTRPSYLLTGDPMNGVVSAMEPVIGRGKNVIVTAPTVVEAHAAAEQLRSVFNDRVLTATSEDSPKARTDAWIQVATKTGSVVVGTREVAFWGAGTIGLAVVLEEGRRAYKSPQTPTYNVRDVLRRRSVIERFALLLAGAVPTSEAYSAGIEIMRSGRRIWPLIEVVDRTEEGESSGRVAERVKRAVAALERSATVFVLVPRRGATFRCVRCRELRKCPACGALLERSGVCARCGEASPNCTSCGGTRFESLGTGVSRMVEDFSRSFGSDVGPAGSGCRITVGTERDLVGLAPVDLVVVVDPDIWILAPNYRADEDALRLLVRAALAAKPGRGRRAIVQTSLANHAVFDALRSGDPLPFMDAVVARREESGFPPVGELIALETDAPDAAELLGEAAGEASLLGPAREAERERWLIQGRDLTRVRMRLRSAVRQLRDGGFRVRVDADPLDL
jgi:primosomal protein N' (replication factor Y)